MANSKRQLREEVAELAQAVRELREQLAAHTCHHCTCTHVQWYTTGGAAGGLYPYTFTYSPGSSTMIGGGSGGAG